MGIKLLLLLGLLIGVLYCLHILAQDYQAITAPKLLRLLFKRELNSSTSTPTVRWKKILKYDPIQCARYLYCDVGARQADNELRRGFIYMLTSVKLDVCVSACVGCGSQADTTFASSNSVYNMLFLDVKEEDIEAFKIFNTTYNEGKLFGSEYCSSKYSICPFKAAILFDLVRYMLRQMNYESELIKNEINFNVTKN